MMLQREISKRLTGKPPCCITLIDRKRKQKKKKHMMYLQRYLKHMQH
jgi:hypothetical protein